MVAIAVRWRVIRRLPSRIRPKSRKTENPMIGSIRMSSNQAMPVDGLRLPGITPSATRRSTMSRPNTIHPSVDVGTSRFMGEPYGILTT